MLDPRTTRRIRTRFSAVSRKLGVLQSLDWARCGFVQIANRTKNRAFKASHPDFPTPPATLAYDAYSSVDWPQYNALGKQIAKKIEQIISQFLSPGPVRFLEWGCGPACVIRHLPAMLPPGSQITGSDYNERTIAWCRSTFPNIQFQENQLGPPLPFGSGEFRCTCGLSVLTHLSKHMCSAWLKELDRVTQEGGIIILTTKGKSHNFRLLRSEQQRLEMGEPVIRDRIQEGKRMYDTILPESYVRSIIPSSLSVLEYVPEGMPEYQQDLWILKRDPVVDAVLKPESGRVSA
jgi:SAM-dependent methyltransferase